MMVSSIWMMSPGSTRADKSTFFPLLSLPALLLIVILVRNTAPRVRVDQALKFFWGPLTGVAALAVALAALGW